ncbi:DUF5675 family protein [Alteromonas sp. RKMC-009]|uniref:DUF5675 family protein n=1 Tax=Alteromonas sp. RKMC-009 TaxID=2267264 RepID=UPI000E68DD34|nr:DUF5675 family protein [Alteromonas sp. RKMC-009]AYA63839.1 hypothetical protein DS731_07395 [Alteromonas sp. RKMC-009]
MKLWLNRLSTDNQGTPGHLFLGPWTAHTLELPWRDNQPNISCIPAGEYPIRLVKTRKPIGGRSHLYLIENVPGRTSILFHAGTFAGNKDEGFKTSVLGCVLTGYRTGSYQNQRAIFDTRRAVGDMLAILGGKPSTLIITNGWEKTHD